MNSNAQQGGGAVVCSGAEKKLSNSSAFDMNIESVTTHVTKTMRTGENMKVATPSVVLVRYVDLCS